LAYNDVIDLDMDQIEKVIDNERWIFTTEEGDWGNICDKDHESNELAIVSGRRIFSVYMCV
jgi:hypothetical protein